MSEWKMVPVEPTNDMVARALRECGDIGAGSCGERSAVDGSDMRAVYDAMIAAAPPAPTSTPDALVANFRVLVMRMARDLQRAGHPAMADKAMDFLKRHGLGPSPLRDEAAPSAEPSAGTAWTLTTPDGQCFDGPALLRESGVGKAAPSAEPADIPCPQCGAALQPGYVRGVRCDACNGRGTVPALPAEPSEPVAWRYPVYWWQPAEMQHTEWHYINRPRGLATAAYEAGVVPQPLYAAPPAEAHRAATAPDDGASMALPDQAREITDARAKEQRAMRESMEAVKELNAAREAMQMALEYCEFAWRDVPMNQYAFDRLENVIYALTKQLEGGR
jgi:hypothetical protein